MKKEDPKQNKLSSHYIIKDFIGLLFIFASVVILLAEFHKAGSISAPIQSAFTYLFGIVYILFTLLLAAIGVFLILDMTRARRIVLIACWTVIFLSIALFLQILLKDSGVIGLQLSRMGNYIGVIPLVVITILIDLVAASLLIDKPLRELLASLKNIRLKKEKLEINTYGDDSGKILVNNQPGTLLIEESETQKTQEDVKVGTFKKPENERKDDIQVKKVISKSNFHLPPLSLLDKREDSPDSGDIRNNIQIIKRTMENFKIPIEIGEITVGPTITRYGIKLAEGIKVAKILALQNDLALALAVNSIRIEAPIPGKSLVGIEVPNRKIAKVRLRSLVEETEFHESDDMLYFPIGRVVTGEPFFGNLAKMPHMLIAGTTGSGKSMFIHAVIASMLLKNTPETLNLLMIDPKRVELIRYENLPHLLMDPILDTKKVVAVMQWLIREMEDRFVVFQDNKARDIDSYNKIMMQKKQQLMPKIVLVIDEMADLMMTHGASIEASIIRLTQMARATGIHLILATQRPSVNVITGLIKANVPNRICFRVASQVDSRTVLDSAGAEKLLGSGDMLFVSTNSATPRRIQAPLISENELERIVDFWIQQGEGDIERPEIRLDDFARNEVGSMEGDEEDDVLLQDAYRLVVETGKASTSFLQRKLKVGYGRAARLLDILEEKGVVGPQEGTKAREVLLPTDASLGQPGEPVHDIDEEEI